MDLTGKWRYRENYGYGTAEGEVVLKQEEEKLSGRIVFMDNTGEEDELMVQEFLIGEIEDRKVKLQAVEVDIIHANTVIEYKLDSWFGLLVDDCTVKGISVDLQGKEGSFVFERMI